MSDFVGKVHLNKKYITIKFNIMTQDNLIVVNGIVMNWADYVEMIRR